jgi:hypothetical protein
MSSTLREPAPGQWGPDVSAYQAAMSVVALHVAQVFIKSSSREAHAWARELAQELQTEACDISPEIGRHLVEMTIQKVDDLPF